MSFFYEGEVVKCNLPIQKLNLTMHVPCTTTDTLRKLLESFSVEGRLPASSIPIPWCIESKELGGGVKGVRSFLAWSFLGTVSMVLSHDHILSHYASAQGSPSLWSECQTSLKTLPPATFLLRHNLWIKIPTPLFLLLYESLCQLNASTKTPGGMLLVWGNVYLSWLNGKQALTLCRGLRVLYTETRVELINRNAKHLSLRFVVWKKLFSVNLKLPWLVQISHIWFQRTKQCHCHDSCGLVANLPQFN